MSWSSYNGIDLGLPPFLDQHDSAGCSSSDSGGRFQRTGDANYERTHSSTEINSADAQPSTARGACRGAGKTRLSILGRFVTGDDGPRASHCHAIASAPRPTTTAGDFAASGIPARQSAPLALNADSIRIPGDRCDMPNPAIAYNAGSRSFRRAVEELSRSEAEVIAVCHSKCVTFGTHSPRASQETEERRRKRHYLGNSGLLESTPSRCLQTSDAINHGFNTGRTEESDLQHLSSTRHLDPSALIEATSAQFELAGNIERRSWALEFGDYPPRPVSPEQKVAAWDPCEEDSSALSPTGELGVFELDMFERRRTGRPKAAPLKPALCCASKSSCTRSPTSPPKSEKLLPVTAADSSMYEDLHWFTESCDKWATSSQLGIRVITAAASTPKAEARPASHSTKACAATGQADKAIAPIGKAEAPSVDPGVSVAFA